MIKFFFKAVTMITLGFVACISIAATTGVAVISAYYAKSPADLIVSVVIGIFLPLSSKFEVIVANINAVYKDLKS